MVLGLSFFFLPIKARCRQYAAVIPDLDTEPISLQFYPTASSALYHRVFLGLSLLVLL